MKFCYLDETGTGQEPVVILVGIIIDIQRMNRTKLEWNGLFDELSQLAKKPITEIHAKDLIPGNDAWRGVDPNTRVQVVDTILNWLGTRNHRVTFSAIDKSRFGTCADIRKSALKNEWVASAFHIALSLQKEHQSKEKNKGHTVLIFDKGKEPIELVELLINPPEWSDTFYNRGKKQSQLDQIIDVPFYADSQHISLIQIADLICYVLRRYSEIKDYGSAENYSGELARYEGWVEKIKALCIATNQRYKKRGACDTSKFFAELAPSSLTKL